MLDLIFRLVLHPATLTGGVSYSVLRKLVKSGLRTVGIFVTHNMTIMEIN